jgi:hypothetical protein
LDEPYWKMFGLHLAASSTQRSCLKSSRYPFSVEETYERPKSAYVQFAIERKLCQSS